MRKKSLVKDSSNIRKKLKDRIDSLELSYGNIVAIAREYDQNNITASTLSRYFNGIPNNSLTEESIVFLCYRFGIPIRVVVGEIKIVDNLVNVTLPVYDEATCIVNTNKIFKPNGEK